MTETVDEAAVSPGSGTQVDLSTFVAQVEARRAELQAQIDVAIGERSAINERIKGLRSELVGVERMWRSTQPRKNSKA